MMYWGNHMSTGSWIFSILGTLVILGLIVGLAVWAVYLRTDRGSSTMATGESAREILDRKLASDELTAQEYTQLREAANDGPGMTSNSQPREPAGARG